MRPTAEQQRSLSRLLTAEQEGLHEMLDILTEEHHLLSDAAPEQIASISTKKLACLNKIEKLRSDREHFLGAMGVPQRDMETTAFIQSLSGNTPVASQWEELRTLTARLRKQNEINGGIIALSQRHTTLALNTLTGRTNTVPTYGPAGETRSSAISNHLAKA